MAFDFWRFMASPHGSVSPSGKSGRGKPASTKKPGVPWLVSVTFFVALLRVLVVTFLLLALAAGLDDPMPTWFDALLLAYGAALIVVLVFVLNGFGWARLAWVVGSLTIIAFLQNPIVGYVLVFDLVVLLVLVMPASNRYMAGCADARRSRK